MYSRQLITPTIQAKGKRNLVNLFYHRMDITLRKSTAQIGCESFKKVISLQVLSPGKVGNRLTCYSFLWARITLAITLRSKKQRYENTQKEAI